jgi:hypothetical protein
MTGSIGAVRIDKGKVIEKIPASVPKEKTPAELTNFERTGMLNKFHQEHGNYKDVDDEVLKEERDEANKAQFLADVGITEEEARNHPPITASRKAFFEDHIDDVLRGNVTFETMDPETARTVAILLSEYNDPATITEDTAGVTKMTSEGLKETFMEHPQTEDRPITDDELDKLLEGFDSEQKTEDKGYIQNEEQTKETLWQKTKELDITEPEKNEIVLPELKNTTEEVIDIADNISVETSIPEQKFTKHKNRIAHDDEYRERIEQRIDDLITKLESKEIKLNDLTDEDQQVIMSILNQNG